MGNAPATHPKAACTGCVILDPAQKYWIRRAPAGLTYAVASCDSSAPNATCICVRPYIVEPDCRNVASDAPGALGKYTVPLITWIVWLPVCVYLTWACVRLLRYKIHNRPHARSSGGMPSRSRWTTVSTAIVFLLLSLVLRQGYWALDPSEAFHIIPQPIIYTMLSAGSCFAFISAVLVVECFVKIVRATLRLHSAADQLQNQRLKWGVRFVVGTLIAMGFVSLVFHIPTPSLERARKIFEDYQSSMLACVAMLILVVLGYWGKKTVVLLRASDGARPSGPRALRRRSLVRVMVRHIALLFFWTSLHLLGYALYAGFRLGNAVFSWAVLMALTRITECGMYYSMLRIMEGSIKSKFGVRYLWDRLREGPLAFGREDRFALSPAQQSFSSVDSGSVRPRPWSTLYDTAEESMEEGASTVKMSLPVNRSERRRQMMHRGDEDATAAGRHGGYANGGGSSSNDSAEDNPPGLWIENPYSVESGVKPALARAAAANGRGSVPRRGSLVADPDDSLLEVE